MLFCQHQVWIGVFLLLTSYMVDCASIEHHFRPIRETNELDKIISTDNQKYDSNNETSALPKTSENTTPSEIAKRTTKLNKLDTSSEFNDKQKENIYLRPVIKHQNNDYSDSSKYELFKTTSKPYVSTAEEEKKNYLKYEVTSESINPGAEEEVKNNIKNKIVGRGSVKYGRGNEDSTTTVKIPIVTQNSPNMYEDKNVKLTETIIYKKKNDSSTESNQNAKSYTIDKYVSQQTHTSNNFFTKPGLVNAEYSNKYGGMSGYADSIPYYNSYTDDIQPFKHYSGFNNFDLTTPKTKIFDDGHSRISNSIKQNLEAVDFDTNARDQTKENSDSVFVTTFDDSHVDYKNFEKLQLSNNQQESKKHGDIDAQNRTLVNIKSEFVETKSYTDIPKNKPIDHSTSESQNIDLTTKLMAEKSTESSVNKDKYIKTVLKSKDFGVSERKLTTVKPKTHSPTDEEEFESVKIVAGITTDMPNFTDEKLNVYTKNKSSYLSTSVPTSIDPLMDDTKLNLEKEHFVNSKENNINLKKRGSTKFINDIVPTNIPNVIINSTMANSRNTTYIEKINTYPEKIVLAFNENDNNNKINTIKNQTFSAGSENHIQSILLNRVSDQDLEKTDKENSVKYIIDKDINSEKNTSTSVSPKEKLNTLRMPSKENDNLEAETSTKMNYEIENETTTVEFETTTYLSTKIVQDTTVDTTTEKTYESTTLTQNFDTESLSSVQGTVDTTEHSTELNEFTTTVTYQTETDMQTTKAQSTVAVSTTEQPTTTDAVTLTDIYSTELKTEPSVLNLTVASTNTPTMSIVPDHNLIAHEEHELDNGHSEENSDTDSILKNMGDDKEKSNSIKPDEKDSLDEIKNDEKDTLDEVRSDDKDTVDEKENLEVIKNSEKDSPDGMKNEEKGAVESIKNKEIEPSGVKIGDKESLDVNHDDSVKNNDKDPSESTDLKTLDEGGVIDEPFDNNENKTMVNNNKETKINDGNQKGFDTISDDHKVSEQGEGIDEEEEHNFGELDINNGTKNTDSNKYGPGSLDKDYDDGVGHDINVQPTTSSITSSSQSTITVDAENNTSTFNRTETLGYRESSSNFTSTEDPDFNGEDGYTTAKIVAIVVSSIAGVCLILLAGLLIILRKRQKRFNFGQRCTPVSLDAYSLDSVSVYNSMRRKGVLHASKRSYGNPAFEDPVSLSHPMSFAALANFMLETEEIANEFDKINQITVQSSEVPPGCEHKNRYANVIPLPETRVFLKIIENEPSSDYINANFVRGFKSKKQCYIACQAPMENTLNDFWRMIWEQNSTVILMLTDLFENGVEKCADYLPPSEGLDCHREFGDFQVTLKKREVKEKYIISSLQLKNMVSNSWRDVTHLWYLGWPERGVPDEVNSIIAFLIEARSYLKTSNRNVDKNNEKETTESSNNYISCDGDNGPGPITVHCSPGTGRTGVVISSDIAIREFEQTRMIDVPKTVYQVRRDRAGAVQTKDQYQFIYKIINLYAAKLTGGVPDSI